MIKGVYCRKLKTDTMRKFEIKYLMRGSGRQIFDDCFGWVYSGDKSFTETVTARDEDDAFAQIFFKQGNAAYNFTIKQI